MVIMRTHSASMLWRVASSLMLFSLGACVSYKPYPGAPAVSNPTANAELYRQYSIQRDSSGVYRAQGRTISPEFYMTQVQPTWFVRDFKEQFRWRDLGWLAALVASGSWQVSTLTNFGQYSPDYGISALSLKAVEFGLLTDFLGRRETSLAKKSLNWNRSLAKDLGQLEPAAWNPMTIKYDDTLPGWKVGLGFSSTRLSGQDYQDYFTPSRGILTFRFSDPWTAGTQLCVGYGFAQSWTLELEEEVVGYRSDGVIWRGSNLNQNMDQIMYQASFRIGRAWDTRMADQYDISLMPLVGLGMGWLSGTGSENDANGNLVGSYVERSTSPAAMGGFRISISPVPHYSYTLETGYRWLRFDYLVVTEGKGVFAGRSSPDLTIRGAQGSWDCSGPFIKIGLMFL